MRFPRAKDLALAQMITSSEHFVQVATHKADVAISNVSNLARYNANAEVKLKAIAGGRPVRRFGNAVAVKHGAFGLKHTLDAAIEAINASGQATQILEPYRGEFSPISAGHADP